MRLQYSKSTLYAVALSKEQQLIAAAVWAFFPQSHQACRGTAGSRDGSGDAHRDLPRGYFGRARARIERVLRRSRYVRSGTGDLHPQHGHRGPPGSGACTTAEPPGHTVDATFISAVAGATMESIQRGEVSAMTGLTGATAYRLLADLIVAAVTSASVRHW